MQEYTTKGKIELLPLPSSAIEGGMKGVIYDDEDKPLIITTEHINSSGYEWTCVDYLGDYFVADSVYIPLIEVEGQQIAIQYRDWKYIIRNQLYRSSKEFEFTIRPQKFKAGKVLKECPECHAHFEAAKSQGLCSNCCMSFATARLIKPSGAKIIKKKGIYTHVQMREIAAWAYELCILEPEMDPDEVGKLVDRYLEEHGNNIN